MLPPNIPSDSRQHKILKAFKKIGFEILPPNRGSGSHRVVRCPKTREEITVQYKIYKVVIKDYCKRVDELGYDVMRFIKYL